MTRKELYDIQKPGTGLRWLRSKKNKDGYCTIHLTLTVKWGSLLTVKDLIEAFRVYLKVGKEQDKQKLELRQEMYRQGI